MKTMEPGLIGLSDVLANALAKYRHHQKNKDLWNRTLRVCINAQRIRRRCPRSLSSRPATKMPLTEWDEAIKAAITQSRQKTNQQIQAAGWERALANKLTSIRQRQMLLPSTRG